MKDLLHKIVYTSIGLAALTEEKAREMVDEMEKRCDVSKDEGKQLAQDLVDKAKEHTEHLRDTVSDEVHRLADKFMWVSREDFDALQRRVKQLEQRLGAADDSDESSDDA